MTIKEAIKKAEENGFKIEFDRHQVNDDYSSLNYEAIFLDPLFWSSLGKAMGWGECKRCDGCGLEYSPIWKEFYSKYPNDSTDEQVEEFFSKIAGVKVKNGTVYNLPEEDTCGDCEGTGRTMDFKYHWHKFIDHLASGKTAEDYFKSL